MQVFPSASTLERSTPDQWTQSLSLEKCSNAANGIHEPTVSGWTVSRLDRKFYKSVMSHITFDNLNCVEFRLCGCFPTCNPGIHSVAVTIALSNESPGPHQSRHDVTVSGRDLPHGGGCRGSGHRATTPSGHGFHDSRLVCCSQECSDASSTSPHHGYVSSKSVPATSAPSTATVATAA